MNDAAAANLPSPAVPISVGNTVEAFRYPPPPIPSATVLSPYYGYGPPQPPQLAWTETPLMWNGPQYGTLSVVNAHHYPAGAISSQPRPGPSTLPISASQRELSRGAIQSRSSPTYAEALIANATIGSSQPMRLQRGAISSVCDPSRIYGIAPRPLRVTTRTRPGHGGALPDTASSTAVPDPVPRLQSGRPVAPAHVPQAPRLGDGRSRRSTANTRSTQQGSRRTQEQIYSGVHEFVCSDCRAGFPTRNRLTHHERIHATNRRYQCTVTTCQASFHLRKDQRRHVRTHDDSAERLSCPYDGCRSKFTRQDNLERHCRTKHT